MSKFCSFVLHFFRAISLSKGDGELLSSGGVPLLAEIAHEASEHPEVRQNSQLVTRVRHAQASEAGIELLELSTQLSQCVLQGLSKAALACRLELSQVSSRI